MVQKDIKDKAIRDINGMEKVLRQIFGKADKVGYGVRWAFHVNVVFVDEVPQEDYGI